MISLDQVEVDREYKILSIQETSPMYRRFLDIGLVPGALVKKVLVNPFGGISAYSIMGAIIAIRDIDGKGVVVIDEEV